MGRWTSLAVAAGAGALLVAGRGRISRLLRTVDQRAGLFAPRGARLYNVVAPPILRPLYVRVADEVAAGPGLRDTASISAVVEIGSGPGELALEVARRLPDAEIVGVDLAEAMVERAAERARHEAHQGSVRFQLADATALPLASESIDVVVSTLSLHHWADPAGVFAEVGRVLRPGGIAVIYDLRAFAYTRRELEVFFAGGPFEGVHFERAPIDAGVLGLFFVRIRLVRPMKA